MSANTRLKLGIAFAVGGNLLFFTSAWIVWMPWPASFKAVLWSILFFAPETGTLIGAAIMGKENYERFKALVSVHLGRIKPAGDVGPIRLYQKMDPSRAALYEERLRYISLLLSDAGNRLFF